jgi:hypothetical protein
MSTHSSPRRRGVVFLLGASVAVAFALGYSVGRSSRDGALTAGGRACATADSPNSFRGHTSVKEDKIFLSPSPVPSASLPTAMQAATETATASGTALALHGNATAVASEEPPSSSVTSSPTPSAVPSPSASSTPVNCSSIPHRPSAAGGVHGGTEAVPAHCGGVVPLSVSHYRVCPPYFFPNTSLAQCSAPPLFRTQDFVTCMRDRGGGRLFFMGNSIARGMAFAMQSILNDNAPVASRASQKELCTKTPTGNGTAQGCTLKFPVPPDLQNATSPQDAQIAVNWRFSMYRRDVKVDKCGSDTPEDCYRHFFRGPSLPADVLILNVGLGYIEDWRARGVWGSPGHTASDIVDDFARFLDARLFNGTLIWTTLTPAHPAKAWGGHNPDIEALSARIASLLQQRNQTVIDMRSFFSAVPV